MTTKDFLNTKEVIYILNAINSENYDKECNTPEEKINFFFDTFNAEFNYDYNKVRYPNIVKRVSNYLQGLPSCINIAFSYYDIEQTLKSWHEYENETMLEKHVNNWFDIIAMYIVKLDEIFNY